MIKHGGLAPPASHHDCGWRGYAEHLQQQLAEVLELQRSQKTELDALKKRVFGKSSEKMPPMDREVRRGKQADPAQAQQTRRKNAELRAKKIETEQVEVPVPEAEQSCPKCGGHDFAPLGDGKLSSVTEYVPGYFRRRVFHRQTMRCRCGEHLVTAAVPDKVFDKTQYGPGSMAHLVASAVTLYRCIDSKKASNALVFQCRAAP